MQTKITFLGTGSMIPTKERKHSAIFISYRNEGILVDCGEGTQIQLMKARISLRRLSKIFITHWHGDHTLGLIGLLQSMSCLAPENKVEIYGPKGTEEKVKTLYKVYNTGNIPNVKVKDVVMGVFFGNKEFELKAVPLEHGINCCGLIFKEKDYRKVDMKKMAKFGLRPGHLIGKLVKGKKIEYQGKTINPEDVSNLVKGKKIGIISDTKLTGGCDIIGKEADLLISEASFMAELEEKAEQYQHLTAAQAAKIALKSKVKKLILTHLSARYKTDKEMLKEAKKIFTNTTCAKDMMEVVV